VTAPPAIRVLHRGAWGLLVEKRLAPGESFDVHRHGRPGFTLTIAGRYVETFDGTPPHEVKTGHVQFKDAGVPHTTCAGAEGAWMWIAMPEASWPGSAGVAMTAPPGLATGRMIALYDAATSGDAALAAAHARALALSLVPPARDAGSGGDWLDAVAGVQARELDRPHSLTAVAARFGVHPVYLARAFRARFGCSPGAYRHRARIERAAARLWRGDTALADLAGDLGFADQSHFNRVFRRHAGVSPGRLRRWAERRRVPIVQDGDPRAS